MSFANDYEKVVEKTGVDFNGKLRMQFENFRPGEPVGNLVLKIRSSNALRRCHVETMGDLLEKLPEIGKLHGVGKDTLKDIKKHFVEYWYDQLDEEGKLRFWAYAIANNGEEGEEDGVQMADDR